MASLLDLLKNPTPSSQPSVAQTGQETGSIRQLLEAKSGKALQIPTGPKQTNIGEQAAITQTGAAMAQQGQQGILATLANQQKSQALTEQAADQTKQTEQAFLFNQQDLDRKTNNLINQFKNQNRDLDNKAYQATAEQLGHVLRMQNDQYINKLKNEGARARLNDEAEFRKQAAVNTFANQIELLKNSQFYDSLMNDDRRTYIDKLAEMDNGAASQIANSEIKAANTRQIFQAGGDTVIQGSKAYREYKKENP